MKKRLLLAALAALMIIVTACSGNNGENGESSGTNNNPGEEQVELRVMWWGDQQRADLTDKVLKLFHEKYPNIKVSGEFAPASGYFDKLNTQLASGTAADIFFLGGNVTDYAIKDVLLDLDPYVGNELNLSDMDQAMVEYGTLGGKLVHVSVGANARGIIVNETMFEKAGIPVPTDGWNWDDYARISKEISEKLGDGVFGTYDFTFEGMDIFFKQNGKQLYDMEKGTLGFDEVDALKWFQYWADTSAAGGVVTPELAITYPVDDPGKSLITTGKAAMNLIPSNQLSAYQGLTTDKLSMVQLPRGTKGTGVVFESSQGMSGYAKTEHPKEVAMLINFFINDPEAAKILGNNRGVPVTSANRELLINEANDVDKIVYDYTGRVSEATKTEPFTVSYNPPGNAEFSKLGKTTVQEIGFGRKTVEQAVKNFYEGTVKIFSNNTQQ
ncbi:MAG: ABC transporter substrate-binding protein [Candidatus Pristimantibacillus sp.]